jgi:putative tricarboxylic transport membrane protein
MTRDVVLGAILLAVAGAYYMTASAIPDSQLADAVGPRGLPDAYAVLLAALSLLLIARSVRARRRPAVAVAGERVDAPARTIRQVAALLAIGIVYIAVVPFAGYLVSIAGLIVATAFYYGGRTDSREHKPATRQVLLVGFAGAALLWLVFVILLGIPQPAGIWSSLW